MIAAFRIESKPNKNSLQPQKEETQRITSDILEFHQIEECNRARIIDWIISVLRAFKVSSHQTLFLAVSILDRYLIAKCK